MLRLYDTETDEKLPPVHVVFGAYDGPIQAGPDKKSSSLEIVVNTGQIGNELVQLESIYSDRSGKNLSMPI